ncbi:MAG: transglutaminase domain-containing protein [Moraxellaceae bacterium]|nr:transglutaminase domain-containing protein [Moraxellaceae bacterium]
MKQRKDGKGRYATSKLAIVVLLGIWLWNLDRTDAPTRNERPAQAKPAPPSGAPAIKPPSPSTTDARHGHARSGTMTHEFSRYELWESEAAHQLEKQQTSSDGVVSISFLREEFAAMAPDISRHFHFVNGYLEGFSPFPVENVWTPLTILARRKSYELDERLYGGRQEVWQSSQQAYHYTRGDCEDHALLLADWLISMGHDARVVLGTVHGNGHAWVILFRDGREFLLEATSKSPRKRYPLASLLPEYRPAMMFNREHFWVNTQKRPTTDYSGPHWALRSRFTPHP